MRKCPVCGNENQEKIHAVVNDVFRTPDGKIVDARCSCDDCNSIWDAHEPLDYWGASVVYQIRLRNEPE